MQKFPILGGRLLKESGRSRFLPRFKFPILGGRLLKIFGLLCQMPD